MERTKTCDEFSLSDKKHENHSWEHCDLYRVLLRSEPAFVESVMALAIQGMDVNLDSLAAAGISVEISYQNPQTSYPLSKLRRSTEYSLIEFCINQDPMQQTTGFSKKNNRWDINATLYQVERSTVDQRYILILPSINDAPVLIVRTSFDNQGFYTKLGTSATSSVGFFYPAS